ncbi:MAG TPA: MurT ligase domain-containing protein [Actinomycetota bacterium]
MRLRESIAVLAARGAGSLSRGLRVGGGSSVPGIVVERLDPGFVRRRAARLTGGVLVVSGTNGKTTTTAMIRAILAEHGASTVSNESGANLLHGVATALLRVRGATMGVFELDEAWLPKVAPLLNPRVVVLTNVFRDQLDRFGEAESVARLLSRGAAAEEGATVVANADDPLLWHALPGEPLGFGVRPEPSRADEATHRADAEPETCPRCGRSLVFEVRTIAHLGVARCPAGDWATAEPSLALRMVSSDGLEATVVETGGVRFRLPIGGIHNVYNAAAAIAGTRAVGVPVETAARALEKFRARFGRSEVLTVGGRTVRMLLTKNPAGASVVIRELARDPGVGAVVVAVNDQVADGRDISWIWDVDYERLAGMDVPVVPAGRRAADVAVRLRYAGATPLPARTDAKQAVLAAIAAAPAGSTVAVLATYTAMLDARAALAGGRRKAVVDA